MHRRRIAQLIERVRLSLRDHEGDAIVGTSSRALGTTSAGDRDCPAWYLARTRPFWRVWSYRIGRHR